jgi:hypothetical protein
MSYLPDTTYQTTGFLYSAGLGFALGIVYDLIRILFYLLTGSDKKSLIVWDIIYLLICLGSTFIFLLVMCSGEVVLYALIGEIIGWVIYHFSVSALIFKPLAAKIKKIRRLLTPKFLKIRSSISHFFKLIQKNIKIPKKNEKNFEKDLHIRHNIVYNFFVKLYNNRASSKKRGDGVGRKEKT